MKSMVSFRCPACNARIKAPAKLLGQWRNCPACRHRFLVHAQPRGDADPLLVAEGPATETQPAR